MSTAVPAPAPDLRLVSDLFSSEVGDDRLPCLTCGDVSLTRVDLRAEIAHVAALLENTHIAAGQLVATSAANSPALVAALLALWAHGCAIAPINPLLSEEERHAVLRRLQPAAFIGDAASAASVQQEHDSLTVIELGDRPVALQVRPGQGDSRLPNDAALVLHTSGTTGSAKAVVLTHQAMLRSLTSVVMFLAGRAQARNTVTGPANLIAFPLSHVAGLYNLLLAFRNQREVVLMPRFTVTEFLAIMRARRLPSVVLNPTMIHMLVESDEATPTDLSSLRFVRSGSAPLSVSVARRFHDKFGVPVLNAYGQTETSGEVIGWTAQDARDFAESKLGSVGRPHPGVSIRFVGDTLSEVPQGEVGELCVKSNAIMTSYLDGQPTGLVDGYLRTGDLGRIDDDGFVWLVGRRSDVIVCGGFKVLPEDVEEVLRLHPAVADVMVAGLPDERLGEAPHAFVVLRAGSEPAAGEFADYVRARMAHYKAPRATHFVAALPRNATGKILRARASELVPLANHH